MAPTGACSLARAVLLGVVLLSVCRGPADAGSAAARAGDTAGGLARFHASCRPKVLFIKAKKCAGSTVAAVLQSIANAKNWSMLQEHNAGKAVRLVSESRRCYDVVATHGPRAVWDTTYFSRAEKKISIVRHPWGRGA